MNDYPNRPLVGVGVVAIKDRRVLLIRRGKPPRAGTWSLPGGRQRLGETVRETARRELREETGIEAAVTALLDVVDSITRDERGAIVYHYTLVDFLAEAVWADPDDLGPFDLWDETLRVIRLGLARCG